MKIFSNVIVIILLLLLVVSCSKNADSDSGFEFYIKDNSKIAAEIIDKKLAIKFSPPLNWSFQSAELSKKVETKSKGIDPTQKNFSYEPVYLFFNDSTGSLLSIGLIDYPDSAMQLNNKLNLYKSLISNKYGRDNLSMANFTKSNINFTQFKIEKGNFVNYKLVFKNSENGIILFDCTIFKNLLVSELDFFKSSIWSIGNIELN